MIFQFLLKPRLPEAQILAQIEARLRLKGPPSTYKKADTIQEWYQSVPAKAVAELAEESDRMSRHGESSDIAGFVIHLVKADNYLADTDTSQHRNLQLYITDPVDNLIPSAGSVDANVVNHITVSDVPGPMPVDAGASETKDPAALPKNLTLDNVAFVLAHTITDLMPGCHIVTAPGPVTGAGFEHKIMIVSLAPSPALCENVVLVNRLLWLCNDKSGNAGLGCVIVPNLKQLQDLVIGGALACWKTGYLAQYDKLRGVMLDSNIYPTLEDSGGGEAAAAFAQYATPALLDTAWDRVPSTDTDPAAATWASFKAATVGVGPHSQELAELAWKSSFMVGLIYV